MDLPYTSFGAGANRKSTRTAPFLISVSLHLAAAWAFSYALRYEPYHEPLRPIEVEIVTALPEKTIPPPQTYREQKSAALVRPLPRPIPAPVSTPPVAAPRPAPPIETMNQAREPVHLPERGVAVTQPVTAATARDKPVTAPQPAVTAFLPHAPAGTSVESGRADLPAIGPSYEAAYLNNPAPPYPTAARRLKLQGTATVRVMVSADGRPTSVTLEKGSGARILDEAAVEAVRHWSFVPARRGDKAIAAVVDVPLRFRLN